MNLKGDERYSVHEIKGVLGDRNEHLREKCLATRRSKIGYIMETLNSESSGMKFQQGISNSFMGSVSQFDCSERLLRLPTFLK